MESFFNFLSDAPDLAISVLILLFFVAFSLVVVYAIAFIQGREISFYPLKIGQKPISTTQDQKHILVSLLDITRTKGKTVLNDPNRASIYLVNRTYMPQLKDVINSAKKEIILYAVQHTFLRHYGLDTLVSKVQKGCKVRI